MNAPAPIHCLQPRCASLATGTACGVETSHCMNQKNLHGFVFAPHCKEAGLHATPEQVRETSSAALSAWKQEAIQRIEAREGGCKRPYFALGGRG